MIETAAQVLLLLLLVGVVRAYMLGGWTEVRHFARSKIVGL